MNHRSDVCFMKEFEFFFFILLRISLLGPTCFDFNIHIFSVPLIDVWPQEEQDFALVKYESWKSSFTV